MAMDDPPESVSSDALEEVPDFNASGVARSKWKEKTANDVEHQKSEAAEGESHDGSGAEGSVERLGPWGIDRCSRNCGARVGEDRDLHAEVAAEDGGSRANGEGDRSEGTVIPLPPIRSGRRGNKDDETKDDNKDCADLVLSGEKRGRSLADGLVDFDEATVSGDAVLVEELEAVRVPQTPFQIRRCGSWRTW